MTTLSLSCSVAALAFGWVGLALVGAQSPPEVGVPEAVAIEEVTVTAERPIPPADATVRSRADFERELTRTTVARADRLNTADRADTQRIPPGGTPGYTLLNLRAGWRINAHATVLAVLDNLLDEPYRVHGSGSNEPGLGGSLGIKVSF